MASEEEVSIVRYLNCVKWQQLESVTVALAGIRTFSTVISIDIFILVYIFFISILFSTDTNNYMWIYWKWRKASNDQ